MDKPRRELPPSDSPPRYCTEKGCLSEAFSQGKCEKHWAASKRGPGRPAKPAATASETKEQASATSAKKVTRLEVETMIIPALAMLGAFVDEAWDPGTIV